MDYYVVRIYREEPNNPTALVGIVEMVETQEKISFSNLQELWAILNSVHAGEKT
jgi:hypothetical protein